jgi:hypothetical protein
LGVLADDDVARLAAKALATRSALSVWPPASRSNWSARPTVAPAEAATASMGLALAPRLWPARASARARARFTVSRRVQAWQGARISASGGTGGDDASTRRRRTRLARVDQVAFAAPGSRKRRRAGLGQAERAAGTSVPRG